MPITDAMRLDHPPYEPDESESHHCAKIVTNRKRHCCVLCRKLVKAGGRMYVERAIVDGEWCSARTCLACVDKHVRLAIGMEACQ